MHFVLKPFCVLIALPLLFACSRASSVSPLESLGSRVASTGRPSKVKKTACLSFQGNGVYFSSHIGALITLLENNFEPVFATGGSSGAILAGVARALVDNPSLRSGGEFQPQAAARVLAASAPIIESVLFLPRFTTPLSLIDSLDVFLSGSAAGVLRANPNDGLANTESIVGQATLVIDYFRSVDFSELLSHDTFSEREKQSALLWKDFAGAIEVTTNQLADALLTDRTTLVQSGKTDLVLIQDRFFKLFRSKKDNFRVNYNSQQEAWNTFIAGNAKVLGLDSQQRRHSLFSTMLEKIKTIENFDAVSATLADQFMLPEPGRVYRAFEGFDSRNNRRIELPTKTIIHSTARRAKRDAFGEWKEALGFESLYQVYFAEPSGVQNVEERLLNPVNNPLQPSDRQMRPVIPSERLVVTTDAMGPVMAATTGEPTAFFRYPLGLDAQARERLGWTTANDSLVGYGGWLEKISIGTARQFKECTPENVDLFFHVSDGVGINRFVKMAFLAIFLDEPLRGLLARQVTDPVDIGALLGGTGPGGQLGTQLSTQEFAALVQSGDHIFAENRAIQGRLGNAPVTLNCVNPSESKGPGAAEANLTFRTNRRAMILASYEYTQRLFAERGLKANHADLWQISGEKVNILGQPSATDVLGVVKSVFPRLNY